MTPDRPDDGPLSPGALSGAAHPDVHPWVREAQQRPRFAIVGTFLPEWAQVRDFAVRAEDTVGATSSMVTPVAGTATGIFNAA